MDPVFAVSASNPAEIHVFTSEDWTSAAPGGALGAFAVASGFRGKQGQRVIAPREDGSIGTVLFGIGDGKDALALAALSAQLPTGDYVLARLPDGFSPVWAAAGWMDGAYRFETYVSTPTTPPRLVLPEDGADAIAREAGAVRLLRCSSLRGLGFNNIEKQYIYIYI